MFVLNKSGTYSWPINFSIPSDGGKQEKKPFDVIFKRLPQSKIKELIDGADVGKVNDNDFCKEVIVGWKGIQYEDGGDVPFSVSSLDDLLDYPMLAKAIVTTYLDSLAGAKVKN